jgi:threonine/homoserine/homoserine lactone efflux protein
MLMATGLTYGFSRGLPHLLGVALGFGFMTLAVGFGLGALLLAAPIAYTLLKYAGAAYLLYLAWAIATASPEFEESAGSGQPISFLQAATFQWLNPKAWVMAVGAVSTYAGVATFPYNMLLIAGLFGGLGLFSSGLWLGFGSGLRRVLTNPRAVRVVNIVMALLLVASIWPVIAEGWR